MKSTLTLLDTARALRGRDLALALLLALLVAACGPGKTVVPDEAPAAEPAATPTPAAPAEPAEPAERAPKPAVAEEDEDEGELGPYDRARMILDEKSIVRFREMAPKVEALLDEALAQEPGRAEIVYNQGIFLLRMGRRVDAQRAFQKVVQLDPNLASAHAQLGALLLDVGNESSARPLLKRALEIEKYNPVAHRTLAILEIGRKNYKGAVDHARQALLGNSDDMGAYLALATCYYRMKRYDLGKLVCFNAISINPHAAPIYNLMGLFLLREDDVKTAITQFEKAIQEDPELLDAHMNLGATTLAYGDFATALKHFEIVLQAEPDNLDALLSRSVAKRGLGELADAKAGYEEVLKRDPDHHDARYNLCILYQDYLEDYESALGACKDYLSRIGKKHPKYKEMARRVRGIKGTLEALKEVGS